MTTTRINLGDPEDIKQELPQVRRLYEAKRKGLEELQQEVEHLRVIVEHMAALAGEPIEDGAKAKHLGPAQQAVVDVVKKAQRPMRAREVAEELQKEQNAVGAALWAAEKNGILKKVGAGLYAPLNYIKPIDNLPPLKRGKH